MNVHGSKMSTVVKTENSRMPLPSRCQVIPGILKYIATKQILKNIYMGK